MDAKATKYQSELDMFTAHTVNTSSTPKNLLPKAQPCKAARPDFSDTWSRFWAQAPKSSKKIEFVCHFHIQQEWLLVSPPPFSSVKLPFPKLLLLPWPHLPAISATLGQLPTDLMMRVNGEVRAKGGTEMHVLRALLWPCLPSPSFLKMDIPFTW